jgi:hypothetical protein
MQIPSPFVGEGARRAGEGLLIFLQMYIKNMYNVQVFEKK